MWRRKRDADLSKELESHLDMHIADNVRAGMTSDEARRQALVALGGVEPAKERYRDMFALAWLDATLAASTVFLLIAAIASMLWPVWRATSRSPVAALRYE